MQAHLYILNNTDEVLPYLYAYKNIAKHKSIRQSEKWVFIKNNNAIV